MPTLWACTVQLLTQHRTDMESSVSSSDGTSLDLSSDEALVLFEWLSRFNETGDATFQDQAEQRVLWSIESRLQSQLVEPFVDSYLTLLAAARARVRDPTD